MWWAMFDHDYGVLAPLMDWIAGRPLAVFHVPVWILPVVAVLTIWWTIGFNVLLFLAGLRNIPRELYEAARARRRRPLGPVPVDHLAADLAGHRAGPDHPAHPAVEGLRPGLSARAAARRADTVLVQYIYIMAFQQNRSGYGSAIAVGLFVIVDDPLGAPIPGAAGARCSDERERQNRRCRHEARSSAFTASARPIAPASCSRWRRSFGAILWAFPLYFCGLRDPQAGA